MMLFPDAVAGLLEGDFSRLAPLFGDDAPDAGQRCAIIDRVEQGMFANEPTITALAMDEYSRGCPTHGNDWQAKSRRVSDV